MMGGFSPIKISNQLLELKFLAGTKIPFTGKKKSCLKLAHDGYTKLDNVVLMIQIIMLVENGTPQQVTSTILNATAPYICLDL